MAVLINHNHAVFDYLGYIDNSKFLKKNECLCMAQILCKTLLFAWFYSQMEMSGSYMHKCIKTSYNMQENYFFFFFIFQQLFCLACLVMQMQVTSQEEFSEWKSSLMAVALVWQHKGLFLRKYGFVQLGLQWRIRSACKSEHSVQKLHCNHWKWIAQQCLLKIDQTAQMLCRMSLD